MIITQNTKLNDLQKIPNGEEIKITKEVSLNQTLFSYLLKNFPNSEITILSGYDSHSYYHSRNQLYNEQDTITLSKNINMARTQFNKDVLFDDGFTVEQAINASRKINTIVSKINSAQVEGKPLSNLEKFLWAYKETTNHFYNEEKEDDPTFSSRNLIAVLNGDKIVCTGFANLLYTLCNRLDIPCTLQPLVCKNKTFSNHLACAVRIDDDKYDIHSIYFSDPTADSARYSASAFGQTSFNYSLVPYKNLKIVYPNGYMLDKGVFDNKKFTSIEKIIQSGSFITRDKILAYLFPEKTQGLSQNEILKQNAESILKQHCIDKHIENYITSISQNEAEKAFDMYLNNSIFNLSRLFDTSSKQSFKNVLDSITQELIYWGFSKEEIFSMFKQQFSEENIISELNLWCENFTEKDSPDFTRLFKGTFLKTKKNLEMIEEAIESFDFESGKKFNPEFELKQTASFITQSCIDDIFSNKDSNPQLQNEIHSKTLLFVGLLLKRGVPLEQIQTFLKNEIKNIDINQLFYAKTDTNANRYYSVNENEFYFTDGVTRPIYNEPYEQSFFELSNSAIYPSNEIMFNALVNIHLSQGNNKALAQKLAKSDLKFSLLNPEFNSLKK